MKIGIAQISPVWLDKQQTLEKIINYTEQAIQESCDLVCFGETLLPGYPFWVELTDGAKFECDRQKELYAYYLSQSVDIGGGELRSLCEIAAKGNISIYLGCLENARDRGGHSVYCTLVYIDALGEIKSTHRKLMPTYEERLVWAIGDGHGLRVHELKEFKVGGLNCWENWMPIPRAILHGMGENLHVAVWPGNLRNTIDLTRHMALEGRSFVVSVSGVLQRSEIPKDLPFSEEIYSKAKDWLADGGSCLAGPDGEWVIPPVIKKEGLYTAIIDVKEVFKARHNFDPSGHYSRPDVFSINVNRDRQGVLRMNE
jgi:nitrilase